MSFFGDSFVTGSGFTSSTLDSAFTSGGFSGTITAPKYIKTRKELTNTQAISRDFSTSLGNATTVSSLTKELCTRVFKPQASVSHIERRVANALKISKELA